MPYIHFLVDLNYQGLSAYWLTPLHGAGTNSSANNILYKFRAIKCTSIEVLLKSVTYSPSVMYKIVKKNISDTELFCFHLQYLWHSNNL